MRRIDRRFVRVDQETCFAQTSCVPSLIQASHSPKDGRFQVKGTIQFSRLLTPFFQCAAPDVQVGLSLLTGLALLTGLGLVELFELFELAELFELFEMALLFAVRFWFCATIKQPTLLLLPHRQETVARSL